MNIRQAKRIPLLLVFEKLGIQPDTAKSQNWYLSPLRAEKTASFHLHPGKSIWFDFGEGKGGNVVDFACAWLESRGHSSTVSDGLKWLEDFRFEPLPERQQPPETETGPLLSLQKLVPIRHPALIRYLETRAIPLQVAKTYMQQAHIRIEKSGKTFFALSMANEEGGLELRTPFMKSCIAPKYGTFIRGSIIQPPGIHLFEGMMDFLSVVTREQGKPLENDSYILHSASNIHTAPPYLKEYGYKMLFSWMHNDKAGVTASNALSEFVKTQHGLVHYPMNKIYTPHKDVNDWHMHQSKPAI